MSYIRKVMDNDEMVEIHPIFLEIAKERGFYSKELLKDIAEKGGVQDFDEIPDDGSIPPVTELGLQHGTSGASD